MPCFNIVRQRSLYFDLLVHYHSTSVVIYSKWGRGTGTTAERTSGAPRRALCSGVKVSVPKERSGYTIGVS